MKSDKQKRRKFEAPSLEPGIRRLEPEHQEAISAGPRTSDVRHQTYDRSLFLASSNPAKLREFREAAAARGVTVEPLPGFAEAPVCVEDGSTFEENARKKAIHYSRRFPGYIFADDSGICVDALDGAPAVYSARFAGPQATDHQNNQRLLADLHSIESHGVQAVIKLASDTGTGPAPNSTPLLRQRSQRAAHYVCVIALAEAGRVLTVTEGRADGVIIDEPRGQGGFGYDPYFFYPPLDRTFAELSSEQKFAVSHRGVAFRQLLDYLCGLKR